ncbi:hypothetical protein FHS31_000951 [Sphingomonas vulcanisoli]|uniref:Folate-binding protein n=1 Tax=Sphingomonas vulcanisoli TaxID=1658060 RepID=A0ABX0TS40_9SPHN|nr:folate-binding protein YgfZ [Sphingomonas vulcanisoli]NIJ07355.1 hypothetical protein [Sphingomonas vulcanisoli]
MPATTLADRAVLRLSGEDPRGFLQGLVTNDVTGPLPVWAGLLNAQGKALFDFLIWADGDDLLIDCEAEQAEALARRLTLYRLRRAITIAPEPALAVHWSAEGPEGVPDPRLPELGRRWIAPPDAGNASAAWRAHRLALGVTEGVAELGRETTLWLEANAAELGGVSFTKGCYVGQENTARMNWRSTVSRRLVVVKAPSDAGTDKPMLYPDLGLSVDRRRVDSLRDGDDWVRPTWLTAAVAAV